ncbi:MAG: hypothetical protein LBG87_07085 [Spirochaetaceae bacterium]|jgi:hypothetical protein|nr:hypothetical protein [Spirochaetaceae bacterium]
MLFKAAGLDFALPAIAASGSLIYRYILSAPMTKEQKQEDRAISRRRILNEHAIRFIKRFRILAEKRNRRKRFGLRCNLIAGICNFELNL